MSSISTFGLQDCQNSFFIIIKGFEKASKNMSLHPSLVSSLSLPPTGVSPRKLLLISPAFAPVGVAVAARESKSSFPVAPSSNSNRNRNCYCFLGLGEREMQKEGKAAFFVWFCSHPRIQTSKLSRDLTGRKSHVSSRDAGKLYGCHK